MRIASAILILFHFVGSTWHHRGAYHSWIDVFRAFQLRVAATRMGKRMFGLCDRRLHFRRVGGAPAFLRQTLPDIIVAQEIFEREEYSAIQKPQLPSDSRIVDLGGNIGLSSLFFAMLYPQGRFVIVEPDEDNCRMIRLNLQSQFEAGRAVLVQAFVGGSDGEVGIDRTGTALGLRMVPLSEGAQERFARISMDTLCQRFSLNRIDLLKCDIEGSEAELFKDCQSWIGRVRHLVVETHEPYSLQSLYDDLARGGWHFDVLESHSRTGFSVCSLKSSADDRREAAS